MRQDLYNHQVTAISDEGSGPVAISACPVCASVSVVPLYAMEGFAERVVTCGQCGLGRLDPHPDAERIRGFYPQEYYGTAGEKFVPLVEQLVRVVAARQAGFVVRDMKRGACVLDVGCGRGVLLRALADRGCEAHGVEISPEAATGVDERISLRFASRLADAAYPSDFFDRVVIWHVLEHVADPRETLLEIHRILKPGGRVIVAVPNFSSIQACWAGAAWFHLDLPRHLFHFPVGSLKRLLENCGFECGAEHHFSLRQNPFGWIQSALNRYSRLPRNSLYELMHQRSVTEGQRFTPRERFLLKAAFALGIVPATLLAVVAAILRRGATVHVVAKRG